MSLLPTSELAHIMDEERPSMGAGEHLITGINKIVHYCAMTKLNQEAQPFPCWNSLMFGLFRFCWCKNVKMSDSSGCSCMRQYRKYL